jgi:hypothetical protein
MSSIQWPNFPDLQVDVNLWPDALNQNTYNAAREIVEAGLVEICNSGELYLTALMNQDLDTVCLVGDVILGRGIEEGDTGEGDVGMQIRGMPAPPEVEEARVFVEAIDRGCTKHRDAPDYKDCPRCQRDRELCVTPLGKAPIRYKDGSTSIVSRSAGRSRRTKSPQPQQQDRWITLSNAPTSAWLTLKQAWLTLRTHGAYVRLAPHQDDREGMWLYREVPPAELRERGEKTRGAKR